MNFHSHKSVKYILVTIYLALVAMGCGESAAKPDPISPTNNQQNEDGLLRNTANMLTSCRINGDFIGNLPKDKARIEQIKIGFILDNKGKFKEYLINRSSDGNPKWVITAASSPSNQTYSQLSDYINNNTDKITSCFRFIKDTTGTFHFFLDEKIPSLGKSERKGVAYTIDTKAVLETLASRVFSTPAKRELFVGDATKHLDNNGNFILTSGF